jgi:hypothetical protein
MHTQARRHARTQTRERAHARACARTRTHARTHACTRTHCTLHFQVPVLPAAVAARQPWHARVRNRQSGQALSSRSIPENPALINPFTVRCTFIALPADQGRPTPNGVLRSLASLCGGGAGECRSQCHRHQSGEFGRRHRSETPIARLLRTTSGPYLGGRTVPLLL